MLVEIAASRCPPASGVLLATGWRVHFTTPGPAGLARPRPSIVHVPRPGLWGRTTPQTLPRRKRSVGSPTGQPAGLERLQGFLGLSGKSQSERFTGRTPCAMVGRTAILHARSLAVLGIAPQRAERVRGHTLAAMSWSVTRLVFKESIGARVRVAPCKAHAREAAARDYRQRGRATLSARTRPRRDRWRRRRPPLYLRVPPGAVLRFVPRPRLVQDLRSSRHGSHSVATNHVI